MDKLSFTLGNIVAWFIPSRVVRNRCRGEINKFFYRRKIRRFLWAELGVRLKTLTYVSQHTLDRAIFLANGKYYVKIFRNVTPKQICYFAYFMDYVRSRLSVFVPPVIPSKCYRMYACEAVPGRQLVNCSADEIRPHVTKLRKQFAKVIAELQSIDVNDIPYDVRMLLPLQHHHAAAFSDASVCVLEHYDINWTNVFVDDNMDICAIIDWDMMYISRNPQHDHNVFSYDWNRKQGK